MDITSVSADSPLPPRPDGQPNLTCLTQLRRFGPTPAVETHIEDDGPPQQVPMVGFWVEADNGVHVETAHTLLDQQMWDAAADQRALAGQVFTALEHYARQLLDRRGNAAHS